MEAVRDLLDNQIVDRKKEKLGRVDGIVAELRPGQPPRLTSLEVGVVVLVRRLGPRLARLAATLGRRGRPPRRPFRIPMSRVREVGLDVVVDLDAQATPALQTERRLRRLISRIPGA